MVSLRRRLFLRTVGLWWAGALCLGVSCTILRPTPDRQPTDRPLILAHYMPWFRAEPQPDGSTAWDHWSWFGKGPKHDPSVRRADGRPDLASVDEPLIGPYDSRDPEVLAYHFRTARAVGIQGFIVDWYGPETYTDDVFARMVETAEVEGGRLALCLEEKTFFPGYAQVDTREEAEAEMARQVRWIMKRYAHRPVYWNESAGPVLLLFRNHQDGALGRHVLTADELAAVRKIVGEPYLLVTPQVDEVPSPDTPSGAYSWVGDDTYLDWFHRAADARRRQIGLALWIGSASPGFDDSGVWGWGQGPRKTDRRMGQEYLRYWSSIQATRPDTVQLVTWNDFNEGTTIEPARSYGFTYINMTEQEVARYLGRPAWLEDNAWPYRVYRLRKTLAACPEAARREKGEAALASWLSAWRSGHRFLLDWRLHRLEKNIGVKEIP